MPGTLLSNYLRTYRKYSGLSQEEVAFLLGATGAQVSRHESFEQIPVLRTALAYEAIFGVPVMELFAGEFEKVEADVRERAKALAGRVLIPGTQGAQKREALAHLLSDI